MSFRHEFLLLRRDRAVITAAMVMIVACALAVVNGVRWRETQRAAQIRAIEAERSEYAARRDAVAAQEAHPPPLDPVLLNLSDPASPYVIGQAGRIATIPLPAMAAAAAGQFDFLALQELVSIRTRQRTVADKDGLENPLQLLAGRFDLAFVTIYLLPLLILALTYNLLSLEREEGTLGLLRCQTRSLGRLLLGKALLRTALMVSLCMAAAVVCGWDGAEPLRLGMWLAVTGCYSLFWCTLALWVNSRGWSSTSNALALTAFWVAAVAIVPASMQLAVTALEPVPSRLELLETVRGRSIDARRDAKKLTDEWYAAHPELVPARYAGPLYDTASGGTMTHIEQDRRTLPLEAKFDASLAARQDLVSRLRVLSPAIAASEALLECSGTGLSRYRLYKGQVKQFREAWLAWFHPKIFRKEALHPADYDAMPLFRYDDEPTPGCAGEASLGGAWLGMVSVVLLYFGLRRMT